MTGFLLVPAQDILRCRSTVKPSRIISNSFSRNVLDTIAAAGLLSSKNPKQATWPEMGIYEGADVSVKIEVQGLEDGPLATDVTVRANLLWPQEARE
jgi:hypothetical protein